MFLIRIDPADYVCVFIRGDRDVNMIKLVNLGIPEHYRRFADEDESVLQASLVDRLEFAADRCR